MARLTYLGHASFKLVSGTRKVIYIDPYAGDYDDDADYVLITHEHSDHNQINKLKLKTRTRIIRVANVLQNGVYKTARLLDFTLVGVPAANEFHNIAECVGFVIRIDDVCLYFAGDTSLVPGMENLAVYRIDYAFLPVDGIYNMGPEEASAAARIIKPHIAVPIHTDPDSLFNEEIANRFNYTNRLIMHPGETLRLVPFRK